MCGACGLPLTGLAAGVGMVACAGAAGVPDGSVGLFGVCLRLKANCVKDHYGCYDCTVFAVPVGAMWLQHV